jgi:hypothetical protein
MELQGLDIEKDVPAFDKAIGNIMNSSDANLKAFFDHGGKLLMYHGWADPGIPASNSVMYYNDVVKSVGGVAQAQIVSGCSCCREWDTAAAATGRAGSNRSVRSMNGGTRGKLRTLLSRRIRRRVWWIESVHYVRILKPRSIRAQGTPTTLRTLSVDEMSASKFTSICTLKTD